MHDVKLYLESCLTIILVTLSLTGVLNIIGLIVGIMVGILTILKLRRDIRIRKMEERIKELELMRKENED